ncbi:MAG TPA: ABC transporter ATP-binding protein [Candidatus Faecousia gallistercoris]|nr:ABC transporter ATP-binding protein [Candidatus Faecousia gallistercoris]
MEFQLRDVHYQYTGRHHTVHAVRGVTATFETGKLSVIMGKSGSGKTTLLSMLAGLLLPTSGTVLLDGNAMENMDRNRLRRERISVIYQDFNLFPLLTVEENAAYSLIIQGRPKAQALELARQKLQSVDISPSQYPRLPATLSGGEQQRVAIARTLAAGSEIVLADEPTGNLDQENSRNIVRILQRLAHEENRCVILVTHDPVVAEAADVVFHMQDGAWAPS